MPPYKIILYCFFIILCPIGIVDWGNCVLALDSPGDDRAADEFGSEPASGDGSAVDESGSEAAFGDDMAADEREIQPKKKKKSKGKKREKGKKEKKSVTKLSNDLRDAKFKELEQFHHNWFNLPPNRVKKSLESAIKFCKVACTKDQCSADTTVSNNCHLMCPTSTLKNCPDLNPQTEASPETPEAPPQNNQAQTQPSEDVSNQTPPVVTVNGAPQEQTQISVQQAPIPSQPNVILPADQTPGGQDGG